MKRILVVSFGFILAIAVSGHAAVLTVTPTSMDGWAFYKTDPGNTYGAGDAVTGMVNGPATPPLGTGSANLNTGSDGSQSAQLRNSSWAGPAIANLTSLNYSTYATSWNGQQLPYLTMYLSNGDRLWFEPDYSSTDFGGSQSAPTLNTWQTWDALDGKWYTDNHFGPGSNATTWANVLATEGSGVTIVNDAGHGGIGGIRIASGYASPGDTFDANVDAFTIGTAAGTTTYDFEAQAAVPEPTTLIIWSLLGAAGIGLTWLRKRAA
jgi:hypothetical protein